MPLHSSTFGYLKPTEKQVEKMDLVRTAAKTYADFIEVHTPNGPDKTYALRKLREVAMWVNIAVTRDANGAPLED
jgi:hypothetical protein